MEQRSHYTYRQVVTIEDEGDKKKRGVYTETRDVIFSPTGERTEQFVKKPSNALIRLKLTEEDFRDIREIQPFLFTTEDFRLYQTRARGEERIDGVDCWVLEVKPKQVFEGQRLFDGMFWVDKRDYSVVRSEGVAVPQILNRKSENLFPRFTTLREKIDGQLWFPVRTIAEDTLPFSTGAVHMRMIIEYSQYKRFGASSTITFGEEKKD